MSTFSKDELVRYSRQLMLPEVGIKGQEKIKNSKVLVVGAGGLGCPVLQYLTAAGVGLIGIIDFDKIELHNLHRQILFSTKDVGKAKAGTAFEKLKKQNPDVSFVVFNEMLCETNAEKIISQFELVVDGSDNFQTRYLVNDMCVKLSKPLVHGSIFKFEGQLALFNYRGSKNLRDLYPEPPNAEDVPNCDEVGVLGAVPGIIGTMMSEMALKVLLGDTQLSNKLLVLNLRDYTLKNIFL